MKRAIVALSILGLLAAAAIYAYRDHADAHPIDADAPVVAPIRLSKSGSETVVRLDSAGLANTRLTVVALQPAIQAGRLELRASVVADPDATTTVRAPVSGRLALLPSQPWPAYGDHLDTGAELGTVSDARPVSIPRGGTVTRVLARPGAIVQAGDPLLELTDFSSPVVTVAWSDDAPTTPPQTIVVTAPGQTAGHAAQLIGPAPEADPVTRGPAFLYRLNKGWSAARPGLLLVAQVPIGGHAARGVLVPAAAVVQWEGLEWAWLRRTGGDFIRVRVPTDRSIAGGWLVGPPWQAGDSVVLVGGEQLLSEEFRARVSVGDEVAE